ncbi:MAG: lipocalin family protein [Phycisphaerales bacterium]|nr:lipocalin family protein [Phycisphaerales bacterium]
MKQLLYCLSFLLLLASCTKTSSTTENTTILRSSKWKMTAYTAKFQFIVGVDSVYDIYKNYDSCRYDDYITFDSSYHGLQYSNTKKCGAELDQTSFDWELRNNQTVLMLNNAQYTTNKVYLEAKIAKINKSTMTITYDDIVYVPIATFPITFRPEPIYYTQTFSKL